MLKYVLFHIDDFAKWSTVKPVLSVYLKIDKIKVLMENGSLMKFENIAECSPWSICQYFRYVMGNENQFLVFILSGRLRQVLLYWYVLQLCKFQIRITWTGKAWANNIVPDQSVPKEQSDNELFLWFAFFSQF